MAEDNKTKEQSPQAILRKNSQNYWMKVGFEIRILKAMFIGLSPFQLSESLILMITGFR